MQCEKEEGKKGKKKASQLGEPKPKRSKDDLLMENDELQKELTGLKKLLGNGKDACQDKKGNQNSSEKPVEAKTYHELLKENGDLQRQVAKLKKSLPKDKDAHQEGNQPEAKTHYDLLRENGELQKQVTKLKKDLAKGGEAAQEEKIEALVKQLEVTKKRFEKEKYLKEFLIGKEKEAREELARLQKHREREAKIAAREGREIIQVEDQSTQTGEELQDAQILNETTLELQQQISKNKGLQEELDRLKISHLELSNKYETDVVTVGQKVDTLQRELDEERKTHEEAVSKHQSLVHNLTTELDALRQQMAEEQTVLQQEAFERESYLARELEELWTQFELQNSLNIELSTQLEVKSEHSQIYLAEVISVGQKVDDLEQERNYLANMVSEQQYLVQSLTIELDALRQQMAEEQTVLQQEAFERESCLARELEELWTKLELQNSLNIELSTQLEVETELSQEYQAEVIPVDVYQFELEQESESLANMASEHQFLVHNFIPELDAFCQQMPEEQTVLQQNAFEREGYLERELEELKTQLDLQNSLNFELSTQLEVKSELSQKYQAEVISVGQKVDDLQLELEQERKSLADTVSEHQSLVQSLTIELDALRQQMAQEQTVLQQKAVEMESCFEWELEELKTKLELQNSLNIELSTQLEVKTELIQKYEAKVISVVVLQLELEQERKSLADMATENKSLVHSLITELDALCQQMAEEQTVQYQKAFKRESCLERQLEALKTKLDLQNIELSTQLKAKSEQKHQADVTALGQKVDILQCELDLEKKSHAEKESELHLLIQNLISELDTIQQKTSEEKTILQQKASERESCLERELEELRSELSLHISSNVELSTKLPEEELCMEELSISDVPTTDPSPKAPEERTRKPPSVWKRTRHALGLRKPKRWKKVKDQIEGE